MTSNNFWPVRTNHDHLNSLIPMQFDKTLTLVTCSTSSHEGVPITSKMTFNWSNSLLSGKGFIQHQRFQKIYIGQLILRKEESKSHQEKAVPDLQYLDNWNCTSMTRSGRNDTPDHDFCILKSSPRTQPQLHTSIACASEFTISSSKTQHKKQAYNSSPSK